MNPRREAIIEAPQKRLLDADPANMDFGKIKVGAKILDDAVLNLGTIRKVNHRFGDKNLILHAIASRNYPLMREISNYFYQTNGIYSRVCDYFAYLYRYDWYIAPEIYDDKVKDEKVLKDFKFLLQFLDGSHIKKVCGDIALSVIKNGAYYGYIVPSSKGVIIQELPVGYCRSRFNCGNAPTVEFNMRFFDDYFADNGQRLSILKMFPKEFQRGYTLFKQGKLQSDRLGHLEESGWYLLDPASSIKFSFNNNDQPLFINAIPALLDLDAAQDLDRRKQMQDLLKIVIQKLPLDKNGDLIFDIDEARDIHNNAVDMLQHAIGVDVLTTFAEISVEDMSDSNTSAKTDDLERVERTVYNYFGTSRNLFNPDGNLSLEKSILDDESTVRSLLLQFNIFFDKITQTLGTNKKKYNFRLYMLETTQYNYKEMSKMYKEQVQIGYSKMLPQIALGHSQSFILHTAHFENEILDLSEIMIPPLMSSTMNPEGMAQLKSGVAGPKAQSNGGAGGRPTKPTDQQSEKTIANKESMS